MNKQTLQTTLRHAMVIVAFTTILSIYALLVNAMGI